MTLILIVRSDLWEDVEQVSRAAALHVTYSYSYEVPAGWTDSIAQQWDKNAVAPECEK